MLYSEKRLQQDLRKIVNDKIHEGFDIVERDPEIILTRGTTKIIVVRVRDKIIIKYC